MSSVEEDAAARLLDSTIRLHEDVTFVEADTHMNLFGLCLLGIVGVEMGLHGLRALDGVNDGIV